MSTLGKIAGTISPLAGMATGQGLFGKLATAGGMGLAAQELTKKKRKPGEPDTSYKKGGSVKKMSKPTASGKSFRSSANGIAKKGKTKAKQIKMAGGGCMKGK